VTTPNRLQTTDQRIGATFVLYPKPFGVQAEYNVGRGPRYDKVTNSVQVSDLDGGYVTLNYKWGITKNNYCIPLLNFSITMVEKTRKRCSKLCSKGL